MANTTPPHERDHQGNVRQWKKAGLSKAEIKHRTDTFRALDTQLQEWREQDFIAPGWKLDWDTGCQEYRVRFRMVGTDLPCSFTATEFALYARGFHDRRKAVMHRAPRR